MAVTAAEPAYTRSVDGNSLAWSGRGDQRTTCRLARGSSLRGAGLRATETRCRLRASEEIGPGAHVGLDRVLGHVRSPKFGPITVELDPERDQGPRVRSVRPKAADAPPADPLEGLRRRTARRRLSRLIRHRPAPALSQCVARLTGQAQEVDSGALDPRVRCASRLQFADGQFWRPPNRPAGGST